MSETMDIRERAQLLAGHLSTVPALASYETPVWADEAVPIIEKHLGAWTKEKDQRIAELELRLRSMTKRVIAE